LLHGDAQTPRATDTVGQRIWHRKGIGSRHRHQRDSSRNRRRMAEKRSARRLGGSWCCRAWWSPSTVPNQNARCTAGDMAAIVRGERRWEQAAMDHGRWTMDPWPDVHTLPIPTTTTTTCESVRVQSWADGRDGCDGRSRRPRLLQQPPLTKDVPSPISNR
jgi:hypothetical protein